MEQRRLRLGDTLDDYCPRERRVTNHAVVAMIEDDIKQTRCTTCDAEHAYKGGHAPRRRKAETTGALYKEVLAGITSEQDPAGTASTMAARHDEHEEPVEEAVPETAAPHDPDAPSGLPAAARRAEAEPSDQPQHDEAQSVADEGPVHRPLIRAQLPRPEGTKVERSIPEFTIRQNGGRNGNFRREGGPRGAGRNNPHQRFGRGPQRGGGGSNRPGRGRRSR